MYQVVTKKKAQTEQINEYFCSKREIIFSSSRILSIEIFSRTLTYLWINWYYIKFLERIKVERKLTIAEYR